MDADTRTKVLTGVSLYDLRKKQWDWQADNPNATITKVHPDQMLPRAAEPVRLGKKLLPQDQMSRRIQYHVRPSPRSRRGGS
jgi:hypothetical protein